MSKKHDEGYALIFVLVVMVVLSIIAISLMSGALKNLTNQTATVDRMQEKYTAQGEMEKVLGEIIQSFQSDGERNNGLASARQDVEKVLIAEKDLLNPDAPLSVKEKTKESVTWILQENDTLRWEDKDCSFGLQVKTDYLQIDCTIILKDIIKSDGSFFWMTKPDITYTSYTITYLNPTEPSEGGGQ